VCVPLGGVVSLAVVVADDDREECVVVLVEDVDG